MQVAVDVASRLSSAWPPAAWEDLHVVAAVSGGADSMALLRGLAAVKQRHRGAGTLFAAHVNHGLRGAESDADQQWLADQCHGLGIPLEVRRIDAAAYAAERQGSLEGAARAVRWRALLEIAESVGARFVAAAHTREDQAETLLFRLLRGTGGRGLAGMRFARPLSSAVTLVRPMLGLTHAELRRYLEGLGQSWREDRTNATLSAARNRIRHELMPLLRSTFNADADAAIARAAAQADELQTVVERAAAGLLERCRQQAASPPAPRGLVLATAPLADEPEIVVAEALRLAWRTADWPEQDMTFSWWRRLARLARGDHAGAALNLPGNILARRAAATLTLAPAGEPA